MRSIGERGSRLYQHIARQLAEAIASGEYPAGSRLPAERKLAERFNVSRPTVREAIIALELAGCVEVIGGSGVYVTTSNPGVTEPNIDAFDILQARLLFESEAAAIAAEVITGDELANLRMALGSMVTENKQQASERAEESLRLLIAKATHNEAIVSVFQHLLSLSKNFTLSTNITEELRLVDLGVRIDGYTRILSALEKRDSAASREAMRNYLIKVVEKLLASKEAQAVEDALRKINRERERFSRIR